MMKTVKKIYCLCFLATILLCGCAKADLEPTVDGNGEIPAGYVRLDVNLVAVNGKVFLTRAGADPLMSYIDDVHLMIFQDKNDDGIIADTDSLVMRNFYEYGVRQNIYLKKSGRYFIYVVANLDDLNCPGGNAATFFDDIATYGDLKRKHVQFQEQSPRQLGKMIMSTQDIIPLSFTDGDVVFAPTIPLQRLQSKFVVTIYNRVAAKDDATVTSGVYPATLSAIDLPRFSYMVEHSIAENTGGKHDYAFSLPNVSDGYYESVAEFLPEMEGVFEYPEGSGRWYTRQTVEFFSFENRRGSNSGISGYDTDGDGPTQNVYGRKALAPEYSTHLRLTSLTRGNALLTYVHAGKGRDTEEVLIPDDITNFDVDRSCVYHFNIVINGVNNVEIDTRRYYLDQLITFTMPDVSRIDAHYMDIPSFILGTVTGYAKIQSGTCDVSANGSIIYDGIEPRNLKFMNDSDPDAERWLRFSWGNPYRPTTTPINTSLYIGMRETDAFTGATPILHFNEYVDDVQRAVVPAVNPSKRTAVIKVGFVSGAMSSAEYDQGVANNMESAFYVPVSQYGLKTIGQVGGYKDGVYTSLLGVEGVEEYKFKYYDRPGYSQDEINVGPYWQYRSRSGGLVGHNQAYDGLRATTDHYNDYRSQFTGGVPPKRWDDVTIPSAGMYNPQSNTNAADYCMRKNRDEDGNGIIEGDEVKWYLPTPVQVMQMYTWRDAFRNGSYTLNPGIPFATSYWTTNEDAATPPYGNAYVVDFSKSVAISSAVSKTDRNPVRCVRDIPGEQQSMFYYSNGYLVADLAGTFPNLDNRKPGEKENVLREPGYNTLARTFLISRWYAPSNTVTPAQSMGNNNLCDNYSEGTYRDWFSPSQQELSLIYAYAGIIENVFEQSLGTPNTATTYHTFRSGPHWAITNIGNNSTFWKVDFATGAADIYSKNASTAYFRCVTYLTDPLPR